MAKCNDGKERFTIYLEGDIHRILEEYAFVESIRTRNTAASEIITDFLLEWEKVSPLKRV